jgi:hypothetical protein
MQVHMLGRGTLSVGMGNSGEISKQEARQIEQQYALLARLE